MSDEERATAAQKLMEGMLKDLEGLTQYKALAELSGVTKKAVKNNVVSYKALMELNASSKYYGISKLLLDDEVVTNPDHSYRAPAKIPLSQLMEQAGLDFRRIVEVYPQAPRRNVVPPTSYHRKLIDNLNESQDKIKFVLIEPRRRRTWLDRLLRRRPAKATIASGPCGCYPCRCELFCHKLSLPEQKR